MPGSNLVSAPKPTNICISYSTWESSIGFYWVIRNFTVFFPKKYYFIQFVYIVNHYSDTAEI
jgi:hypothetical protein